MMSVGSNLNIFCVDVHMKLNPLHPSAFVHLSLTPLPYPHGRHKWMTPFFPVTSRQVVSVPIFLIIPAWRMLFFHFTFPISDPCIYREAEHTYTFLWESQRQVNFERYRFKLLTKRRNM